jgi:hypothetical protein
MESNFITSNTLKDDMKGLWSGIFHNLVFLAFLSYAITLHILDSDQYFKTSTEKLNTWRIRGGCGQKLEQVGVTLGQSYQVELLQSGKRK